MMALSEKGVQVKAVNEWHSYICLDLKFKKWLGGKRDVRCLYGGNRGNRGNKLADSQKWVPSPFVVK